MNNVKDIYINSINELHKGAIAIYDEIFINNIKSFKVIINDYSDKYIDKLAIFADILNDMSKQFNVEIMVSINEK